MDFLHVSHGKIVGEAQQPIHLRGVNVGGWMNMENFINGYPGTESHLRWLMAQKLGREKAQFFFDRLLDHFLTEEDVRFLKSAGVNLLRLPLNYRHFEDDMAPGEYLEAGFKRLDQVLNWCEGQGIYVLLDLHAVQGWQNGDWHSDNPTRNTLFWTQKDFQDRFFNLWQEIARRYKNRSVVAAYNLINEPLSNAQFGRYLPDEQYVGDWQNFNRINRLAVQRIRSVDSVHMIMLEGDYYSVLFEGFELPEDSNLILSSHDYIGICTSQLEHYPATIDGQYWDRAQIERQLFETQGYQASKKMGLPLLISEFGFNNHHASGKTGAQIEAFADQMDVFNKSDIHWTFWTYKDLGSMGWLQLHPESEYIRTIAPVLKAKEVLRTDFGWLSGYEGEVQQHIEGLSNLVDSFVPALDKSANMRYFSQATMSTYTADILQLAYVEQFIDKTEKQIDQILSSFRLQECLQNQQLNKIVEGRFSSVV
jgi:Endoglucanase